MLERGLRIVLEAPGGGQSTPSKDPEQLAPSLQVGGFRHDGEPRPEPIGIVAESPFFVMWIAKNIAEVESSFAQHFLGIVRPSSVRAKIQDIVVI